MIGLRSPLTIPLVVSPRGRFGEPRPRRHGVHQGVDFVGLLGSPVVAAVAGEVARKGFDPAPPAGGGGGYFLIEHVELAGSGGLEVWEVGYMHLARPALPAVGDQLALGDRIGDLGATGAVASGPHLHFQAKQVLPGGERRAIDPLSALVGELVKFSSSPSGGGALLLLLAAGLLWLAARS